MAGGGPKKPAIPATETDFDLVVVGGLNATAPDSSLLMYYQIERLAAEQLGLRWQDRGLAASEGFEELRGQRRRAQRERWGNRGGRNHELFEAFYT